MGRQDDKVAEEGESIQAERLDAVHSSSVSSRDLAVG